MLIQRKRQGPWMTIVICILVVLWSAPFAFAFSVSGVITDPEGNPISGLRVEAHSDKCWNGQVLNWTTTDGSGQFILDALPSEGAYIVTSNDDENLVDTWWDGNSGASDCNQAILVLGQANNLNMSLGDSLGRITDFEGDPIVNVLVEAWSDRCYGSLLKSVRTDSNGRFNFDNLQSEKVYIETNAVADQLNWVDKYWDGTWNATLFCDLAVPVDLTNVTDSIDIFLDMGGSISGLITDDEDNPVSNLEVQPRSNKCHGDILKDARKEVRTNATGEYIIYGVPATEVYVATCAACDGRDYADDWWDNSAGAIDCEQAVSVTVPENGNVSNINMSLEQGATISGQIVDTSGDPVIYPVVGLEVTVRWERCEALEHGVSYYPRPWTSTSSSGTYTLHSVPPGEIYVVTDAAGSQLNYVDKWWREPQPLQDPTGTSNCQLASSITATPGSSISGIDMITSIEYGSVSGRVTDEQGNPIEHIYVMALSDGCQPEEDFGGAFTDANGNFHLYGLSPGMVYIGTHSPPQKYIDGVWDGNNIATDCSLAAPVTVNVGQDTGSINMSLELGGSISGRVTDTNGEPIPDLYVMGLSEKCLGGGDLGVGTFTDPNGDYTMYGVSVGEVYVGIYSGQSNYVEKVWDGNNGSTDCELGVPVNVIAGQDSGGINMSLELGGSISGRITDSNGDPISNIYVMGLSEKCLGGGDLNTGSFTDSDGNYTLYRVPVGEVYVGIYSGDSNYVEKVWDGNDGSTDCEQGVPINVVAGQNVGGINMSLALGGSISGRITNTNGDPLPNIYVMGLSDKCVGGGDLGVGAFTDSNGDYTMYGVPVGSIYVETYSGSLNYIDEVWDGINGSSDCNDGMPVIVVAGVDTAGINFSLMVYATQLIGQGGGTVSLPDESVSVFFPEDAVSAEVLVSIVQVDEASVPPASGGFQLLGDVYEFSAGGLTQFGDDPLILTFHYDPEMVALQQLVEEELTICYYDGSWLTIQSEVDTENHIVTGYTDHFTMFSILGEPIPEPTTLLFVGTGLVGVLMLARRRNRKK